MFWVICLVVRRSVASMSFTIWPQIVNSNETRYGFNTLHPQQYNVVLMKQNLISNAGPQIKVPTSVESNTSSSTCLLAPKPGSNIGKFKTISANPSHINSNNAPPPVVEIKKVKGKSQEETKQLKDLVEEFKKKWQQNVSFCLPCNLECGSIELLQEHKENAGFICRICTDHFKTHTDLETHFYTHKPDKCEICKEIFFSRKDLLIHKKGVHPNARVQCDVCNRTFSRGRTLKAHKNVKHSGSNNTYKCVVCGKMFPTRGQLYNHLFKVHNAYESQECKFCDSLFVGPENLKMHIKGKHLESEINNLLGCKFCGKVFKGVHNLSQHEETHDDTECLCELCGQSFRGKSAMKNHMINRHSKRESFNCKYCAKQFGVKMELTRHYKKCPKKIKTVPDPVCCEICGKQYKNSTILKMHKKIHCEERPYKCDECGATFRQSVTLKTHSRVHSSVGKYCCNDCGMSFKWKQTYDNHMNKCTATNQRLKEVTSDQ